MVAEDLLFWISPLGDAPTPDPNVLCRRHADAMVVPRGWTLDDRREEIPRLFRPRPAGEQPAPVKRSRSRTAAPDRGPAPEQLQIDGTGEIARPSTGPTNGDADAAVDESDDSDTTWLPSFDADDDLDGLLEASSPLLARAFRGTDRPKT